MNPEIYRFTSFTTSNCYIIRPFNDEICFFVDLPPDLQEPLTYVKKNNLTIGGALVTHGHFDHALGMNSFNAPIHMNLEDEFLARNPQDQLSMFTNNRLTSDNFDGEIREVNNSGLDFIKIYHNPGHTEGSTSFEFTDLGLIFTGDFIFKDSIGRTDLSTGNNLDMINSLKNIYTLFSPDFEILPGHGPSEKVSNISKNNIFVKEHIYD